jgi:hypothetical protein
MDKNEKLKAEASAVQEKSSSAPKASDTQEPLFSLECLRADCLAVFGVTQSTFDGATFGLKGEFTISAIKEIIEAWHNKPLLPPDKKGEN